LKNHEFGLGRGRMRRKDNDGEIYHGAVAPNAEHPEGAIAESFDFSLVRGSLNIEAVSGHCDPYPLYRSRQVRFAEVAVNSQANAPTG
jgi:hypothetical protein